MDWLSMISSQIRQKGTSLASQNLADTVFALADSLELLDALDPTKVVVLGGDFWRRDGSGQYVPTYENWYIERSPDEGKLDYINRSISNAREEIRRRSDKDYFVSLTCRIVA